jgi:hypothetical protein
MRFASVENAGSLIAYSGATMTDATPLYEALYVSSLAAGEAVSKVGQIISGARSFNKAHKISGLLIFDGQRFCQQIEGPEDQIFPLLQRIENDSRHLEFIMLHRAPIAKRRFEQFSMGYTVTNDVDVLAAIERLRGAGAMQAFLDLHSHLDLA